MFFILKKKKYHEISEEEALKWYKDWGKSLKYKYKAKSCPILLYGGSMGDDMNQKLRNGMDPDDDIINLNKDILSAPRIQQNIIVYRYVTKKVATEILEQKRYHEKGFLSTSISQNYVHIENEGLDNNYPIIKIYVPSGSCAAYVNAINGVYSTDNVEHCWEQEMLFPCGCILSRFGRVYKEKEKYYINCLLSY